jgi:hypothetical protein
MVLPVHDVVAFAAPAIKQPGPLARHRIEQLRRQGEGFGPARDAVAGMGDQSGPVEVQRFAAFIAKIVSCG